MRTLLNVVSGFLKLRTPVNIDNGIVIMPAHVRIFPNGTTGFEINSYSNKGDAVINK